MQSEGEAMYVDQFAHLPEDVDKHFSEMLSLLRWSSYDTSSCTKLERDHLLKEEFAIMFGKVPHM